MTELTAGDVMTKEVTTVTDSTTVERLIRVFRVSHFTGLPVVDAEGKAVGLVSETDILRALAYALNPPTSGEYKLDERERGATTRLLNAANDADVQIHAAVIMRQLMTRKACELMTPVVHSCRPESSLAEVCETMVWKEIHRVIVTDEEGRVVGLITSLDLARNFGEFIRKSESK